MTFFYRKNVEIRSTRKGRTVCDHTDIYTNGDCKPCDRKRNDRYRRRQRLGLAMLQAAEARGLTGSQAIAVLQRADYALLHGLGIEG
jgi:hypothetical protein